MWTMLRESPTVEGGGAGCEVGCLLGQRTSYIYYPPWSALSLVTSPQRNYSLGSEIHTGTWPLIQSIEMKCFITS